MAAGLLLEKRTGFSWKVAEIYRVLVWKKVWKVCKTFCTPERKQRLCKFGAVILPAGKQQRKCLKKLRKVLDRDKLN